MNIGGNGDKEADHSGATKKTAEENTESDNEVKKREDNKHVSDSDKNLEKYLDDSKQAIALNQSKIDTDEDEARLHDQDTSSENSKSDKKVIKDTNSNKHKSQNPTNIVDHKKEAESQPSKKRTHSVTFSETPNGEKVPLLTDIPRSPTRNRGDSYSQTPRSEEEWLEIAEEAENAEKSREPQIFVPKRYILLFMTFLGFVNIYALRVNLNVAIVAMVNNKTVVLKSGEIQHHAAEFQWDSKTQGIVLASFYYGYWVLQIPGAWIAMKLGGTRVFGYGVLLASLLALITPVATRYSVYALIGVRIFQGLFLGVTFPTNHAIWSKWAPPLERSTLVTMAIAGCPVGNILAIPTTGILSKYGFDGGWPSVFYFFGILGVIWYLLWELTAYQSPGKHPTINIAEREFIENSIGEKAFDPAKESLPWFAIMTSIPMWAIIIGHFGACWGYYTLFTQMPTYLKDIQHLDIKTMGFVAATPYILKAFVGPIGGISADLLLRKRWLSLRGIRALFYGIGCCLAGGFILGTGYCVRQGDAIAMLILGVGFSGLNATGYAVNHLDIGPRYAGVLMGISNTFATIPGFLSPMITGLITKQKKPSEWKAVFWITFIVYMVCVGLYSVMCSGDKQPWAEVSQDDNKEPEKR